MLRSLARLSNDDLLTEVRRLAQCELYFGAGASVDLDAMHR